MASLHFEPSQKQNSSFVFVTVEGSNSVESKVSFAFATELLVKMLLITWLVVLISKAINI